MKEYKITLTTSEGEEINNTQRPTLSKDKPLKIVKQYTLTLYTSCGDVMDTTQVHAVNKSDARRIVKRFLMYQGLSNKKYKIS
jgi:hypothetical protein